MIITREVVERDGKRFNGMRTFNLGFLTQYGDTEAASTLMKELNNLNKK
jgi:hypothetical protein